MRITCPSCAAHYEVPAARLRPGKLVRCVRCGADWLPEPDAPDSDAPADHDDQEPQPEYPLAASLPRVTAMDRLAASPAPQLPSTRLIGAWILTFVVLAGALFAAVGWRQSVVRAWPPSSRILGVGGHMPAQRGPVPPPGPTPKAGQVENTVHAAPSGPAPNAVPAGEPAQTPGKKPE